MKLNIAVLPGDGIGPEISVQGVEVMSAVCEKFGHEVHYEYALCGADAIDKVDDPFPEETYRICKDADAVLFSAVGDPKFDNDPTAKVRPEQGLLAMRKKLGLFANIRPVQTFKCLLHKSPLRAELVDGADFLCILATTGETPCLSKEEKVKIKNLVVEINKGRLPILMGCGGNNTKAVIEEIQATDWSGISGILSVCPYYNKPSQEGLYQHFKAIANASPLPVVLYNVPGRTGVNMTSETTVRLANDCENIVAVKEASGNLEQVDEIIKNKPDGFDVISGDDALTFSMVASGAAGVISVIGNALPKEFSRMIRLEFKGEYEAARNIHHKFTELYKLLFVDGNPAGVKALLHEMGFIDNVLRLPLVPTRITTVQKMSEILKTLKI